MANPNHGNRRNNLQHLLPINNITKIMKKALPPNAKISKESKLAVRECLYEFITFFTSEANDKCRRDKKKTVTANHLLSAMESLGFEDYLDPLKLYSAKYKEVAELGPGYYSQFYREGPLYGSQQQMEGRKWEELPEGCLVEVFEKVGVQSLLAVPLVCKSWYKAASSPQCWTKLIITYQPSCPRWFYNLKRRRKRPSCSPEEAIIKLTIAHSQGSANILEFPRGFSVTKPLLNFAAERCPSINTLSLPNGTTGFSISHLFSRWKNLETLKLGSSAYLADIVAQISTHCPNFARLHLQSLHIDNSTASAIATFLPNIKFLDLKFAFLDKESLVSILQGCKKLEYFDVSWIFRAIEVDDETLKLGSHIKTFKHEFKEEEDYYGSYECDCCYESPPYNATRVNANDYDYDYDYDY